MSGRLVPVKAVLERLEAECRERGVRLIYDDLKSEGGLCRLRECRLLIINRRASVETRIRIVRDALARLPAARAGTEAVAGDEQPLPVPEPARSERES